MTATPSAGTSGPAGPIDTEPRRGVTASLADTVQFLERGYGWTCTVCGSLVVGADGQDSHRRHHRALAALGRRTEL